MRSKPSLRTISALPHVTTPPTPLCYARWSVVGCVGSRAEDACVESTAMRSAEARAQPSNPVGMSGVQLASFLPTSWMRSCGRLSVHS
jgi:hypothetical protein